MRSATTKRRWRRTRGVAMTEFLVGLPMLILLWAGVDYFRVAYARRLETLSQSHAEAWAKAYSNDGSCYAGKTPWGGFTDNSGSMPDGNGNGQTLDKNFKSSMFFYDHATSLKKLSVNSSRWSATVASSTTITCNEVVPDEKSDDNVLTPLTDFIKSFL